MIVISYRCWRDRFVSDPHAIGRSVKINGFPFTLIGVAPPGFLGTEFILSADYWVPMSMESQVGPGNNWLDSRGSNQVWVLGRLRPSVSRKQAEAELDSIGQQLGRAYPDQFDAKAKFYCGLMSAWRPAFDIPISTSLHPNSSILGFALATTLLTTLLFGMAPALQAVRTDVTPGIKKIASPSIFGGGACAIF